MRLLHRHFSALACLGAVLLFSGCSQKEQEVLLPEPIQIPMDKVPLAPGITGLASFEARVLVLGREDYPQRSSDALSGASPVDLAVAWGSAALHEAREAVELSQSDRRYYWRARERDMDIPGVSDFTQHSGNWHIIPADPAIAEKIDQIEEGDIVTMKGELVLVTFPNGRYYVSSLSRTDTGDGACEVFRVTSVSIE